MPAPYEPKEGDAGILWDGVMLPTSPPLAYTPCKGEIGLNNGGVFLPLEPACNTAKSDDFPQIVITQPFDGEPPFIDQVGMAVATPCVAPYDWSKAVASRTMILDTTPDAIATPEEKAVPGYVANPGLFLSSKTMEDFNTETTVEAIHLEAGKTYRILTVGDTDFVTEFGASANTVGVEFVASVNGGAGSGTGTTTHLAGKYNDKDGVAFRYTFLPTAAAVSAGSFVVGDTYTITVVGSTNWASIGAPYNTSGLYTAGIVFKATGIGSGTGTATPTAAIPYPAMRSGQTRYRYKASLNFGTTAVGTLWDGVAFLPQVNPVSGTIRIVAYRYGLLLSSYPDTTSYDSVTPGTAYEVLVKIGKATATWNKAAGTLTLSSDTPSVVFKYSTDGTAPTTTYTIPISITATKTVRWYASKTGMVDSTEWQTVVTFTDEGPANFATAYFSTLPAFTDYSDSIRDVELQFQRKPDWYITPTGIGDGLTPATASNATDIIGLAPSTAGKAYGYRQITASKSGTADIALVRAGANPSGSLMKYSTDGTTFSTYSAAVTPPAPGRFYFKLIRADATDFTRRFIQPWFIGTGTGVQINAVWDLAGQTLTLTYEPTPTEAADITVLYSLDGSTPSIVYSAPVTIVATCTPKVKAIHTARETHDFSTSSGVYDCTTIDPEATADYDEDHAATFTADATIPTLIHKQDGDLVWCSEGTYTNPSGTAAVYFKNTGGIIVRGGYNEDFTERDVKSRKTIWARAASGVWGVNTYAIYLGGTLDGCWLAPWEDHVPGALGFAAMYFNCHIEGTVDFQNGGTLYSFCGSYYHYNCTTDLTITAGGGSDPDDTGTLVLYSGYADAYGRMGHFYNSDTVISVTVAAGHGISNATNSYGTVYVGGHHSGTLTVEVTTGNGAAGIAEIPEEQIPSNGGSSVAIVYVRGFGDLYPFDGYKAGGVFDGCQAEITALSGNGGAGGDGGYYDGGIGGGSEARVECPVTGDISLLAASVTSGSAGAPGTNQLLGGAPVAMYRGGAFMKGELQADVTSGNGAGTTYNGTQATVVIYNNTNLLTTWPMMTYRPKVSGSASCGTGTYQQAELTWLSSPYQIPVYLEIADISFIEAYPYSSGNPIRVDGANGNYGWYSGVVDGNGAPLLGYETPQGTGIALGRYWE